MADRTAYWAVVGEYELPARPASAGTARTLVTSALAGSSEEQLDAARLLVTELVGNAVRGSAEPIELRIAVTDGTIGIALRDHATGVPTPRRATDDSGSGRGLHLVEVLSSTWGWDVDDAGKTVWFEL